jgi:uncharacterized membrane protein YjjP (DUF1212 family)
MNVTASDIAIKFLPIIDSFIPDPVRSRRSALRSARHLVMLAFIAGFSAPLLALLYHYLNFDEAGIVVLSGGMVMLLSPLALKIGVRLALVREIFVCALYGLKIWLAYHLGGLEAPTIAWFLLCPMIAMLLGGERPGIVWTAIVSVTALALFYMERTGIHFSVSPVSNPQLLQLVSILALFTLSTVLLLLFRDNPA